MQSYLDPWSSQSHLDRQVDQRQDYATLKSYWEGNGGKLIRIGPRGMFDRDRMLSTTEGKFDPEQAIFLGLFDGEPYFAETDLQDIANPSSVRDANLPAPREVVTAATAILAWHESGNFCTNCGGQLINDLGGFSKTCTDPACGMQVFPRQDPAMIVAVQDHQDRLLLAHQRRWRPGYISILAGFLEAGESVEQAVFREVNEESGLKVSAVKYLGSQPWPFPSSLMLAFSARASGRLQVDHDELEYAHWYSVDELKQAAAEGTVVLPTAGSVASRVVAAWLEGNLPKPES